MNYFLLSWIKCTGKPKISSNNTIVSSNYIVKEGDSCELYCDVQYSNELNSTIQWILPNNQAVTKKNIDVENISVEDDKSLYECKYNDALDQDSTSFTLNVQC